MDDESRPELTTAWTNVVVHGACDKGRLVRAEWKGQVLPKKEESVNDGQSRHSRVRLDDLNVIFVR